MHKLFCTSTYGTDLEPSPTPRVIGHSAPARHSALELRQGSHYRTERCLWCLQEKLGDFSAPFIQRSTESTPSCSHLMFFTSSCFTFSGVWKQFGLSYHHKTKTLCLLAALQASRPAQPETGRHVPWSPPAPARHQTAMVLPQNNAGKVLCRRGWCVGCSGLCLQPQGVHRAMGSVPNSKERSQGPSRVPAVASPASVVGWAAGTSPAP